MLVFLRRAGTAGGGGGAEGRRAMTDAEKKLIESTFGTNHLEVDDVKIDHMVQYGYPREYIMKCLQENLPNYTTAGYYLLRMDQTYT